MLLFMLIVVIFRTAKVFECKDIKLAQIEIRTLHNTIEKLTADKKNLSNEIKVHIICLKIIKFCDFLSHY